ncbi:hypothetical protein CEJ39_08625 [Rhodococcus pyridinivorans]|nr:hypothetical protein CEJ39_08625 [Rhodococcus pyridinivorans]
MPAQDFRRNFKAISGLGVLLVVVTTAAAHHRGRTRGPARGPGARYLQFADARCGPAPPRPRGDPIAGAERTTLTVVSRRGRPAREPASRRTV